MRLLRACILGLLVAGSPAHAERETRPILVFESHVGPRPAALKAVMGTLSDALETRGFVARPSSVLRVGGDCIPRPGILDPHLTNADIAQLHNDAIAKFHAARWAEARDALTKVLDIVYRNPGLMGNDISNLDLTFRSMVALAVTYQRLGEPSEAMREMKEVIRIFSSRPVSRAEAWGKEGEKLYLDATKQLQPVPRGRLTISAGDPEAQISVEGQQRGVGNVSLADMWPGNQRIFIRSPRTMGRQFRIAVEPGGESHLKVEPTIDAILWANEDRVSLEFASETERKNDGRYASSIARRCTGGGTAVVVASGEDNDRPVLDGALFRDGKEIRRGRIYVDALDTDSVDKLAQFLDDGRPAAGVDVIKTDTQLAVTAAAPSAQLRWWPAAMLVGSAAVLGGSALLYFLSAEDYAHPERRYTDRKSLGLEVYSGAAGLAGVGVYSWLTRSRGMPRLPAAMYGAGTATLLLGALYIPADQDTRLDGPQRPYYWNTAVPGLVLAGVGVGFVVTGYVLAQRVEPAGPTMSVTRDGMAVGWTGRF